MAREPRADGSTVTVTFVGCGDAFGSGGRFQTCFLIEDPGGSFLIDCGASSLIALKQAGLGHAAIDSILVSHLHGDHFAGIPLLVMEACFTGRGRPIRIAGPPGLEQRLRETMEMLFPGSSRHVEDVPVLFHELRPGEDQKIGSRSVRVVEVSHPSGAPSYALRVDCGGKVVAFSGDTEWTESLFEVSREADLFISECYYFEPEGHYHLDYLKLSSVQHELGCRRLILTHLGPEMLARLDELSIECASDGMQLSL